VCGLKFQQTQGYYQLLNVAPFAGVWIEIQGYVEKDSKTLVAPFAGVWIEITYLHFIQKSKTVAPFAGVWIEIETVSNLIIPEESRTLRGCVD